MSLSLELPQDLEEELAKEAARLGLPLADYALRLLAAGRSKKDLTSGAELVAYWQEEGLVGTHSDIQNAQEHARRLRHEAERRFRE